ncbi:MAG: Rpn family recombination-promoting nuclease/putative transposase [Planctomycetes bacterium]|nr:Rpn family recombination-promoting nuclease/putative transposase [Planctomycetota bacterium]
MTNPHDALFRGVFADPTNAGPLLRMLLPGRVAEAFDWATLRQGPTSTVESVLTTKVRDLLFCVRVLGTVLQAEFQLEHKSWRELLTIVQVLGYTSARWRQADIAAAAGLLPIVVSVLIHHGDEPWRLPRTIRELLDAAGLAVLDPDLADALAALTVGMTLLVLDLAAMSEAEIAALPLPPVARLALLALQFLRGADSEAVLAALWRWQSLVVEVYGAPGGALACEALGSYIVEVTDLPVQRLRDEMTRLVDPRAGEEIMSTAERLRAEGRTEGKIEGKQQSLLRLATQRFGKVPEAARQRVSAASEADLDRWMDRLLAARSIAELLA